MNNEIMNKKLMNKKLIKLFLNWFKGNIVIF